LSLSYKKRVKIFLLEKIKNGGNIKKKLKKVQNKIMEINFGLRRDDIGLSFFLEKNVGNSVPRLKTLLKMLFCNLRRNYYRS
jgi:hypothetical protein